MKLRLEDIKSQKMKNLVHQIDYLGTPHPKGQPINAQTKEMVLRVYDSHIKDGYKSSKVQQIL